MKSPRTGAVDLGGMTLGQGAAGGEDVDFTSPAYYGANECTQVGNT